MSKTILITGTSSGFGRYTAESLRRAGHTVYASMRGSEGRNRESAEALRTLGIKTVELDVIDDLTRREAQRACELARGGKLLRLWLLPAEPSTSRVLGLWRARNLSELQAILSSLPLDPWMTTQTTPLTQHPNDPGSAKS